MNKRGKISVVSRYGGLKFEGEDEWYNPLTTEIKEQILKEIKPNDFVSVEVEGKKITSISKIENKQIEEAKPQLIQNPLGIDWKKKFYDNEKKQKQIMVEATLNTAVEILKMTLKTSEYKDTSSLSVDKKAESLTEIVISISKRLQKEVMHDERL